MLRAIYEDLEPAFNTLARFVIDNSDRLFRVEDEIFASLKPLSELAPLEDQQAAGTIVGPRGQIVIKVASDLKPDELERIAYGLREALR